MPKQESKESLFSRLNRLFRSGPIVKRKIRGKDTHLALPDGVYSSAANIFMKSFSPVYNNMMGGSMNMSERLARFDDFQNMELCIAGDTKIAIPGGYKTIKELADEYGVDKQFIVYSYDHNTKTIVPAWAKQARQTATTEAFKVNFDNGKFIIGTSDHKLMKRDGTFCEIQDLSPGDAMMPFERRDIVNHLGDEGNGYRYIYNMERSHKTKSGWRSEHKMVSEFVIQRDLLKNEVVHHKNFKRWDNRPENLEVMTDIEHSQLHKKLWTSVWSKIPIEKVKEIRQNHSNFMKINNPAQRNDINFPTILTWCETNNFRLNELCNALKADTGIIYRHLQKNGFKDFSTFAKAYCPNWEKTIDIANEKNPRWKHDITFQSICNVYQKGDTQASLAKKLSSTYMVIRKRIKKEGYKNFANFVETYNNTKVVSIEPYGIIPLYDLTVDGYKNFATDSVISHNTSEIGAALNIFADETVASDDKGRVIHIYSNNPKVKSLLEDLFYNIMNAEFNLRPWARNLVKYGDIFLLNDISPEYGVQNVIPIPVTEVERIEGFDPKDPMAVKFRWYRAGNKELENWEVTHIRLLGNDMHLPYGTCHEKTTKILTDDGIKEIQHIKKGDKVISFDLKTQQKVSSSVLDVVCSGVKPCFELRTKHNFLRTSKEHKILYWNKETNSFDYKNVLDFKIGDLLATSTEHDIKKQIPINKMQPEGINKNGYWNTSNNIPDYVTPDFAKLFGFLIGDGWIANNQIMFANGVEEEQNEYYRNLLKTFSGSSQINIGSTKHRTSTCNSKMLVNILKTMGFEGKATTKRIPNWVYSTSAEIKESFVNGLFDADGSSHIDKWNCERKCFELSNYELIKDLKILIQTLGYKTGKISQRKSRKSVFIEGRKIINVQTSFMFYWFKSKNNQTKKYDIKDRLTNDFVIEPIVSIEPCGEHETWDIYVENENHNFFANGIITHNSMLESARKIWRQLILAEDAMLVYRLTRASDRRVFYIDIGNAPEEEAERLVERAKTNLHRGAVVDKTSGKMDLRYNALNVEEDYFIATRGSESATKIENLAGGQNTAAVEDLKYLQAKLFAALQIPRAYLGYDESLTGKANLAAEDIRFSRTINMIQKTIISELNKIAIIHLFAHGFDGDDLLDFSLKLSNPSTVAQQQKLELYRTMFEIAASVPENLLSRNYLHKQVLGLNDEDIAKNDKQILDDAKFIKKIESAGGGEEGGGGLFGGGGEEAGGGGEAGGAEKKPAAEKGPPEELKASEEPEEEENPELDLLTSDAEPARKHISIPGKPVRPMNQIQRMKHNRNRRRRHGAEATETPDFTNSLRPDNDPHDHEHLRRAGKNILSVDDSTQLDDSTLLREFVNSLDESEKQEQAKQTGINPGISSDFARTLYRMEERKKFTSRKKTITEEDEIDISLEFDSLNDENLLIENNHSNYNLEDEDPDDESEGTNGNEEE
jgi:intein/homing endonuclease